MSVGSSLVAGCGLTLVAFVWLFTGEVQSSRAESMSGVVISVPANDLNLSMQNALAADSRAESLVPAMPLLRPASDRLWMYGRQAGVRDRQSPMNESFGVSKLAFPLLVGDLSAIGQKTKFSVSTGRTVGVR